MGQAQLLCLARVLLRKSKVSLQHCTVLYSDSTLVGVTVTILVSALLGTGRYTHHYWIALY